MTMVTLSVASWEEVGHRVERELAGKTQGAHITFASADLLWQVLTRERWELLQTLIGAGALSVHEIGRRLERSDDAVERDVEELAQAGIVDRTAVGKVLFPYDGVHVDFRLMAA